MNQPGRRERVPVNLSQVQHVDTCMSCIQYVVYTCIPWFLAPLVLKITCLQILGKARA